VRRWGWLFPVALAVCIYVPTCWGQFVWDDVIVVKRQLLVFKDIGTVFFPPDHIPQWAQNYYRPVIVLTYLLDSRLYGQTSPVGPHVSNIVFHAVVTFFVWLFALQCFRNFAHRLWGATVAASIFAVHPIHTESVSWITGRSDAVAALFMMSSIVVALHYRNRKALWALFSAPVLYLLALLAKEVAISSLLILPFLFLLVPLGSEGQKPADMGRCPPANPKRRKTTAERPLRDATGSQALVTPWSRMPFPLLGLFALMTAFYLVVREQAFVSYGTSLGLGVGELLARALRATAFYALKAVVPPPQLHFVALENLPAVLTSSLILSAAGLAVFAGTRIDRQFRYVTWLSLSWFACTISPSLFIAVAKVSEAPVAERYLYIPSVGVALFLGGLFCRGAERKQLRKVVVTLAVVITGLYGTGTALRNLVWMDNIRLWTDAANKSPNQGLPWAELGMEYNTRNDLDHALSCFHKAVAADYDQEGRSITHSNIGMVHLRRAELEKAETHFQEAIRQRETYATPYYGLGLTALEMAGKAQSPNDAMKQAESATRHFGKAVALDPGYTKAFWGLTRSYVILGDTANKEGDTKRADTLYRLAIQAFESLVRIDPRFPLEHARQAEAIEQLRARINPVHQ
jgi:Tfp pilus assembly protein PilF